MKNWMLLTIKELSFINNTRIRFPFGTIYALPNVALTLEYMSDVDFIRLSALVFATRLIGKTADPISEGTEMAERLFNKLKEKEEQ